MRVWPMNATSVSKVRSGRPRQFCVMWQNSRCSILFHLLVPGGKWQTGIARPMSSARRCKRDFQPRGDTVAAARVGGDLERVAVG